MLGKIKKPSVRVFKAFVIVIVAMILIVMYSAYQNTKLFKKIYGDNRNNTIVVDVNKRVENIDTDSDGLYDWEEELWGSDIKDSDTDGDGTSDGIEVSLGRNPVIPGPNDEIGQNIDLENDLNIPTVETDPDSYTSQVGVDLLQRILQASQTSSGLNQQELINQIKEETENIVNIPNIYSNNNVIIGSNDEDVIRRYINDFAQIYIDETIRLGDSRIESDDDFAKAMTSFYTNIAVRTSSLVTPTDLAQIHINYLNGTYKVYKYFEFIQQETKDPLLAYTAIPKLDSALNQQRQSFEQIVNFVKNSDIIFEEGEPAYELLNK